MPQLYDWSLAEVWDFIIHVPLLGIPLLIAFAIILLFLALGVLAILLMSAR